MNSRTPVALLSLGIAMASVAMTGLHWQWAFYPALESGPISDIFVYAGILLVLLMVTAIAVALTVYTGVRALIYRVEPSLSEGVNR